MTYSKQHFENGEVLTAEQLNHIEDGIVMLESEIGNFSSALSDVIAYQEQWIGE